MAKKLYAITLSFGPWQNQLCFSGEDDELAEIRWADAKKELEEVGSRCTGSSQFFDEAVKHFEKYGFSRIQK